MEAQLTVTGWVGTDVELRPAADDLTAWATFRLASTPRFHRNGEWVDGNTTWLTVKTFRSLAENVAISLRRGTPVIVVGRLRTDVWDDPKTGERQERQVLEATTVGHDLSLGSSRFKRNDREPEETATPTTVASQETVEEATETRELAMA